MPVPDDLPELLVYDAPAWRTWLGEHHLHAPGVWLRLAKKGTSEPTRLAYGEALKEALCHGWIDGQVRRCGETPHPQRRRPRAAS